MIISGDDPVSRGEQRFLVFTGAGKRREWPPEVKVSIAAECCPSSDGASAVERQHGLDPSQVYTWRRDLRKQLKADGLMLQSPEPEAFAFVPALIESISMPDPAPPCSSRR